MRSVLRPKGSLPALGIPCLSTPRRIKPLLRHSARRNGADPDLYGADSYGLLFAYKAAVEAAGATDTDSVRASLEGLSWDTPQGTKTIRAGDHQAMQPMYVVEVKNGQFTIARSIAGEDAIGPDTCDKF